MALLNVGTPARSNQARGGERGGRPVGHKHGAGSPRQSLTLVRVGRVTGRRRDKVQQELVVELEQGGHRTLHHRRLGATGGCAVMHLMAHWRRAWHGGVRAAWLQVREREGCLDGECGAWSRSRRSAEKPWAWALGLGDFGGLLGRAVLVGPVLAPRADAAVRLPPATALARAHRMGGAVLYSIHFVWEAGSVE